MSEQKWNPIIQRWLDKTLNRREFLKSQALGAAAVAAGTSGLFFPKISFAGTVPDVAVAKGTPAQALRATIKLMGGIGKFVKPGQKVLIKPNMSFTNKPEMATTTNPDVVRELALLCHEAGASSIVVADYPLASAHECLANSGILGACKGIGGTRVLGATNDALYKETNISSGVTLKKNGFLKDALAADVLIAVPIAKSHAATGVSLSMKGMMGLVWDRRVMHRTNLSSSIVDICTVLKPDLAIIDASRVLSTNGPGGPGKILTPNMIIASRDMVAADAYATAAFKWYGKNYLPRQVSYLRLAAQRGLGRLDIENMTVKQVTV